MRALILSDIHSNLPALEAVLAHAPEHDAVWVLGDVVGYGADPNEVIDRVRDLGTIFVRGNHDRACCGLMPLEDFNPVAAQAVIWTQRVLTEEHLRWLRALPHGPIAATEEASCAHGSPLDEDTYLVSMHDAIVPLVQARTRITFFGHTHLQGGFATNGDDLFTLHSEFATTTDAESFLLELRQGARYLLNPGSVGQPRDGDWRAGFALYDDDAASLKFYRVPYAVEEAQRRIRAAGLPDRLALRLRTGS